MFFGIAVPNFGNCCGSARKLADLAVDAENSGWDGFFVFDHIQYTFNDPSPLVDPWIALAAVAVGTKRIRIGPLVTPVARRRPWKLAREATSIDHLSNGRLTVGVGLGDPVDVEFQPFGEEAEDKVRGAKLDEGLQILAGLWGGKSFNFHGKHYQLQNALFLPPPIQHPRVPIWVAGRWPRKAPFIRAARWDGVFPLGLARGSRLSPDEVREVMLFINRRRVGTSPYDVVATSGEEGRVDSLETLRAYAHAGATWWLQDLRKWRNTERELVNRIDEGPPRI